MFPELFTIPDFGFGEFTIFTYGVVLAAAYLLAIWISVWRSKQIGLDPKVMMDAAIILLISAIVGAKLFYIIGHLPEMIAEPSRLIDTMRAGGVFQGGLIVAAIAGIWYLHYKKQPFWVFADVIAPAVALGQAIGRVGCYAAGCCYGKECSPDFFLASYFGPKSVGAPAGIPLHPVQMYASVLMLIVFFILMYAWKKRSFDGQIFWLYVIVYSIVRGGIIEFFRGDHPPVFLGLHGQQLIAVVTLVIGIGMYMFLKKKGYDELSKLKGKK